MSESKLYDDSIIKLQKKKITSYNNDIPLKFVLYIFSTISYTVYILIG